MRYTLPKGYLSASAISMLQRCPKQYEFRYIQNKILPPNAALATGSIAHKTLETYFLDVMSSRSRLTPKQTGELSVTVLDEWLQENENTMTGNEREEAIGVLPDLMERYVQNVGQNLNPVAVETKAEMITPGGVKVLGYIDLEYTPVGSDDKRPRIADYKVTTKKKTMSELKNSLQFNLYSLMTGIGNIQIHNMLKTKGRPISRPSKEEGVIDYATNLRVLEYEFDGSQYGHFTNLVETAAALITSGIFMPCDPTSWCCNPEWCGYWNLCRGGGASGA